MNILSRTRNIPTSIWVVALIVIFSVTLGSGNLLAAPIGINLPTSSVTITHNPLPGALPADSVGGLGTVTPSMPFHTDVSGVDFSAGAGRTATAVAPNLFALLVFAGTGVSQFDPAPNVPASSLRIDFSIDYLFDAGGFALPWNQFANFPLVSFAGPGDLVTFSATVDFFSGALGGLIGPGVSATFTNPGLGFLAGNAIDIEPAAAAIPANDTVRMFGSIIFTADNQTGEAEIFMSQDGGANVPVPEPSTVALFVSGLAVIAAFGRKRLAKKL